MKTNLLLLVALLATTITVHAQLNKSEYKASGGFLVGTNYSWLRLQDYPDNYKAVGKFGFVGGAFASLPISNKLSLQPEALYSCMGGKIEDEINKNSDVMQKLYYISVPILLKYHVGNNLAIVVGPQADYLAFTKYWVGNSLESDNASTLNAFDYAATAGIEVMPRSTISLLVRYIHGFNSVPKDLPDRSSYNQGVQATLSARIFGSGEKIIPPPPPPPPDSDGDSIIDPQDKCPNQPGVRAYDGCPIPDTDGDSILDPDDQCPTVAGTAKYQGCPIPDTDGDGFNDEQDKCPNEAGVSQYNGCPIPDSDNDGMKDPDDKCPNITGVIENNGCPAVEKFSASNVQFVTGSSQLTSKAISELNNVVAYLQKYPEIKLAINGHTDDVGDDEKNQVLSEKRAAAVKAQLEKKGISPDRLTSQGFGETQPIADNTTKEGRALNRRVEFKFQQ